ncbi:unnamed protein product [Callosobruchus maculatus]|uniref:Uncharacterized protein n=1 Tax=Callosobruchus maculatus TaxID=64391 RepID=A0A653DAT1_CALMS|nr:unnamed protein product [Callosobruchus maculatus]
MRKTMCTLVNAITISLGLSVVVALDDLPQGFPRCHRSDPELEKCLLEATETVRPYMITGVPNFLPSIQNFSIPQVVLQDGNEVLNYRAQFNNVTLYGLKTTNSKNIALTIKI